jgi:hypothetical protein
MRLLQDIGNGLLLYPVPACSIVIANSVDHIANRDSSKSSLQSKRLLRWTMIALTMLYVSLSLTSPHTIAYCTSLHSYLFSLCVLTMFHITSILSHTRYATTLGLAAAWDLMLPLIVMLHARPSVFFNATHTSSVVLNATCTSLYCLKCHTHVPLLSVMLHARP